VNEGKEGPFPGKKNKKGKVRVSSMTTKKAVERTWRQAGVTITNKKLGKKNDVRHPIRAEDPRGEKGINTERETVRKSGTPPRTKWMGSCKHISFRRAPNPGN